MQNNFDIEETYEDKITLELDDYYKEKEIFEAYMTFKKAVEEILTDESTPEEKLDDIKQELRYLEEEL